MGRPIPADDVSGDGEHKDEAKERKYRQHAILLLESMMILMHIFPTNCYCHDPIKPNPVLDCEHDPHPDLELIGQS
jgi:hypothetical protein